MPGIQEPLRLPPSASLPGGPSSRGSERSQRTVHEKVTALMAFKRTFWLSLALWAACIQPGFFVAESAAGDDIVVYRDLPYRDGASQNWKLDLALKKDSQGKPRPGIVVIHGGGWIEGDKSSFSTANGDVPGNIQHFARLGFVAVTVNYRLSSEAVFPAALEDCKTAVRLAASARQGIQSRPRCDWSVGQLGWGPPRIAAGHGGQRSTPRRRRPVPGAIKLGTGGRE